MESRNLSILLTDIQGFSTRTAASTRFDLSEMIDTHESLLRPIIIFYKGEIIKTMGDSFLCAFESATDASVCAIAIQAALQDHNRRKKGAWELLKIRIMISSGDVTLNHGDIYGDAVNEVSRMGRLKDFENGGIALSEATYLLVNRQEIVAELLGERELKGLPGPVKIYRLPLERQKLDRLPTRLADLGEQPDRGAQKARSLTGREPGPGADQRPGWKQALSGFLVAGALALAFFLGTIGTRTRNPAPDRGDMKMLQLFLSSGFSQENLVRRENFKGTREQFAEVDLDNDGIVTEVELGMWASSHQMPQRRPGDTHRD